MSNFKAKMYENFLYEITVNSLKIDILKRKGVSDGIIVDYPTSLTT